MSEELTFDVNYKGESVSGILWGGNLATVVSLCGQDFLPDEDFIFFIEDLNEPVYKIIDAVKSTLEKTPPELAADVMDHGIMMTGGGSLLTNLDKLLSNETGMPVLVSEDALSCVGEGTGRSLENIELLKRVVMTTKKLK